MKRLSDYTDLECIEKSGELSEPLFKILSDDKIVEMLSSDDNSEKRAVIGEIMKRYPKEALKMIKIVDDEEPVTASNAFPRFFSVFSDATNDPFLIDFFKDAVARLQEQ